MSLPKIRREAKEQLADKSVQRALGKPHLGVEDLEAFASTIYSLSEGWTSDAGVERDRVPLVSGAVLQGSFPVFAAYRTGHKERAIVILIETWARSASEFDPGVREKVNPILLKCRQVELPKHHKKESVEAVGDKDLLIYNAAVSEVLVEQAKDLEARQTLAEMKSRLRLSYDELGQMLGVSGETVRRWEQGFSHASDENIGKIRQMFDALQKLTRIFQPERLPDVLRRKAEAFGGERALDWILRGRIAEVANQYETAFAYQG